MFSIRNASVDDIELIRKLTYEVWPQTYASILEQEQIDYMLDLIYSEDALRKQMTTEKCRFLLVYDEKEPVGFASYSETDRKVFKLHKLYVLPSQQGKGTGKFVLDHIINEIRLENGSALQLQVNRYNKALIFYERLGFKIIYQADFDIGNGYFMNDYVMELML